MNHRIVLVQRDPRSELVIKPKQNEVQKTGVNAMRGTISSYSLTTKIIPCCSLCYEFPRCQHFRPFRPEAVDGGNLLPTVIINHFYRIRQSCLDNNLLWLVLMLTICFSGQNTKNIDNHYGVQTIYIYMYIYIYITLKITVVLNDREHWQASNFMTKYEDVSLYFLDYFEGVEVFITVLWYKTTAYSLNPVFAVICLVCTP